MISPGTQQELYPVWRLAWLGILHISCACTTLQPDSIGGLWVEQQQWLLPIELLAYSSWFSSWSTLQSRIVTEANILPALSVLDDRCPDIQLARKLTYSLDYDDLPSLSAARRLERRHNSQRRRIRPHCGDCSDNKRNLPPAFAGVRCGCECVTRTWVSSLSNQYRWGSISPLKHHRDSSKYGFSDHFSNMVNTRWKHVKCFICKRKLYDENWLEAYYQQYHPISKNKGLLPDRILPPAGWDRPEPSWFDFSRWT